MLCILHRDDGNWTIAAEIDTMGRPLPGVFFVDRRPMSSITLEVENGVLRDLKAQLDAIFPETDRDVETVKEETNDEYMAFAHYIAEEGPSKPVLDSFIAGYKLGAKAVHEGRY